MKSCKEGDILLESQVFSHVINQTSRDEVCDYCFNKPSFYADIFPAAPLKRCTGCQVVYYCHRDCQTKAWKEHKAECTYLKRVAPRIPTDTVRLICRILLKQNVWEAGERMPDGSYRTFKDLMTHEKDIKACGKRYEAFLSFLNIVQICLGPDIAQPDNVWQVYCRVLINSVEINDDLQGSVGIGVYLAFSAVDHSCRPNVSTVFVGRSLRLPALHPFKLPVDVGQLRISYVSKVLTREHRAKILKEQYYFTCACEFCQTDPIRPDPALLCSNCSARTATQPSIPNSSSTKPDTDCDTFCVGCHGLLSAGQIETAQRWRYRSEALLQQDEGGGDSEDVFASFEEGTKLMAKSDLTLYNIAEETCIRAIRVQNMDLLVQSVIFQLHLQRIFYHKHSLTILNSLGMLFKGLLAVGRLDEAKQIFPELIRLVRLNYGEHHNLYKYMVALIT